MKIFIYSIGFFILFSAPNRLKAQLNEGMDNIAFLADATMNAMHAAHREAASRALYEKFKTILEEGDGASLDLDSVVWISQLMPPDSSFKLVSWQLVKEKKASEYFNFIIWNDGSYVELKDGGSDVAMDAEYSIFKPKEVLGFYYYKIAPTNLRNDDSKSYFLYGFRNHNEFESMKTIDVLSFVDGTPILGKEIFVSTDEKGSEILKTRLVLQHSSDSYVSFQINPEREMIIFDHLIPRMGMQPGQGPTMLPDGSYEAYLRHKDQWIYNPKVFHQVSEEAPRPNPVLEERSKDIFGKG